MFAGGRTTINSPLVLGEPAVRRSEITGTAVKHGSTGDLLFVTVRSSYRQGEEVRLVEEQDLVYRSDDGIRRTTAYAAGVSANSTTSLESPEAGRGRRGWRATPL